MSEPARLTVRRFEAGAALDEFLGRRLSVSRKQAKRLLDARRVFVNGRRVWIAHHALGAGDQIEVWIDKPSRHVPGHTAALPQTLFADEHYLVVNKPAGILSNGELSVEGLLRQAGGMPEARAAHRLDRDTTGCLLCAKTAAAFERAIGLFRSGLVRKQYHAIVAGRVARPEFTIIAPLDGQSAVTRFRTLDSRAEASHLLVDLKTGRTHQIRRHLASLGHPVLGDKEHGNKRELGERERRVGRQMLHASRLEFEHPFGHGRVRCESALPRDFRACLRLFRLT